MLTTANIERLMLAAFEFNPFRLQAYGTCVCDMGAPSYSTMRHTCDKKTIIHL